MIILSDIPTGIIKVATEILFEMTISTAHVLISPANPETTSLTIETRYLDCNTVSVCFRRSRDILY